MNIHIVQANGRDHDGEILLVTLKEIDAKQRVRRHLIEHNKTSDVTDAIAEQLQADALVLPLDEFIAKYNTAWVDWAFYTTHDVPVAVLGSKVVWSG